MIKANQIRKGNIVHYPVDGTMCLCTIDGEDIKLIETKPPYAKDHHPIPLTEEWLLNFGFKKAKDETKITYFNIDTEHAKYVIYSYKQKFDFTIDCNEFCKVLRQLRYVHELQNLFFALTGKELKMKKK